MTCEVCRKEPISIVAATLGNLLCWVCNSLRIAVKKDPDCCLGALEAVE